ncbi:MAG: phage head closure protein [Desulfosporosinus sp.]
MRIGDLKHRITIQQLITVNDEVFLSPWLCVPPRPTNPNGFDEGLWVPTRTVWASKSNLDGREFWSAKAVQSENTVVFGIRYTEFIEILDTRTYRIVHGPRIYNIIFIDNTEFRNRFVKIKTLELVT